MKKIGLLSDTHGYWDEKYITYFAECDEIWHAGDIGSMEVAQKLENFKPFRATLEGVDVLITHIGGYPGKYDPRIRNTLFAKPPKLFIAGHSHILKVMFDKKIQCLHMNPGAAGKYGFQAVRTLLRFVLDAENIRDLEVIELNENKLG